MNIKIVVCYHKQAKIYENDLYLPLHLGKALSNDNIGIKGDDTGDNISDLNPYFNEATGIYWAWKNLKNFDYIGLCHYRRYFLFDDKSDNFQFEYITTDEEMERISFNPEKLKQRINGIDVILTRKARYTTSIQKLYNKLHGTPSMLALRNAVKELYPEYIEAYDELMNTNLTSRCNMIIAKVSVYDDFCKWYFDILFKLHNTAKEGYPDLLQPRKIAFLSEILMPVYFIHHKNDLNIDYLPIAVINPEKRRVSNIRYILSNIKSQLRYFKNR